MATVHGCEEGCTTGGVSEVRAVDCLDATLPRPGLLRYTESNLPRRSCSPGLHGIARENRCHLMCVQYVSLRCLRGRVGPSSCNPLDSVTSWHAHDSFLHGYSDATRSSAAAAVHLSSQEGRCASSRTTWWLPRGIHDGIQSHPSRLFSGGQWISRGYQRLQCYDLALRIHFGLFWMKAGIASNQSVQQRLRSSRS